MLAEIKAKIKLSNAWTSYERWAEVDLLLSEIRALFIKRKGMELEYIQGTIKEEKKNGD